MTSPFKSTLGLAARRRQRPVVERSTFVLARVGQTMFAVPVEQVERVLRAIRSSDTVLHESEPLPVHPLTALLASRDPEALEGEHRVLLLRAQRDAAARFAVSAHDVREVCAIETALVTPVSRTAGETGTASPPSTHPAVRGRFTWRGEIVWVLDAARVREP